MPELFKIGLSRSTVGQGSGKAIASLVLNACKIFHQEVGDNFSARDFENVFEVFLVVQLNKCIICLAYQVQMENQKGEGYKI